MADFDLGGLLFGNAPSSGLEGYLDPEQLRRMQQQGVMQAAMALLKASGPSTQRVGLGQALGEAYGAGQAGYQQAQQQGIAGLLTKQKLEEAERARKMQENYAKMVAGLTGGQAPEMGAMTPESALAAPVTPQLPAGPTIARAEMIGQPTRSLGGGGAMQRGTLTPQMAMLLSQMTPKEGMQELLKLLQPPETQGEPYKGNDGNYYLRLKSGASIPYQGTTPAPKPSGKPEELMIGGKRQMVQFYDDSTYQVVPDIGQIVKPMGAPFKATDISGKPVLLSQMTDNTYKTVEGFGPTRDMVQVDVGGQIKFVDKDQIPAGSSFTKGLSPQIVGSPDTGYFVYGGGGGGQAAPGGTIVGGKTPSAAPAVAGTPSAAPVPGARQVAPGLNQIIPGTSFKNDEQLRGEFTRNMEPFVGLAQAFEKIQVAALNPSGAGDISLIYGYMKILDPRSTVMQGEQASAQNAGSVPESIRAKYNSIIAGDKLDPNVRADFLNQARLIIESQRTMANDVRDRYSELAKAYGLKPEQIIFDPFKRIKAPGEVVKAATPVKAKQWWEQYDLLPKNN